MTRPRNMAAACIALALSIAGAASGAPNAAARQAAPVVANGVLQGAPYRIDIPEHWNGSLVMLLHGYEPKGMPRGEPWPQNEATPVFLQHGYAVAASAYSSQGWAVAEALPDTERLRQYFAAAYGKPRHPIWLVFPWVVSKPWPALNRRANRTTGRCHCAASMCPRPKFLPMAS